MESKTEPNEIKHKPQGLNSLCVRNQHTQLVLHEIWIRTQPKTKYNHSNARKYYRNV